MEQTSEELIKRNIRMNRYKNITNIILIIVILAIGFYVFSEIEAFKTLGKDVCRLCEAKTGGTCFAMGS